jgi:hypothetical protein
MIKLVCVLLAAFGYLGLVAFLRWRMKSAGITFFGRVYRICIVCNSPFDYPADPDDPGPALCIQCREISRAWQDFDDLRGWPASDNFSGEGKGIQCGDPNWEKRWIITKETDTNDQK